MTPTTPRPPGERPHRVPRRLATVMCVVVLTLLGTALTTPAGARSNSAGQAEASTVLTTSRGAPSLRVSVPRRAVRHVMVTVRTDADALLRVHVRGQRVRQAEIPAQGSLRRVRLTPDDGLRHGRNRVRVTVVRDGRTAETTRIVRVRRTAPLAAAGHHHDTTAGRRVVLDARASRASRPRASLSYRWTMVRAPRDSRARLSAPRSRVAGLVPDVPGRFVLRVTVTQRASTSGRVARSLRSSSDTTVVQASHDGVGIGVPVDTLDTSAGQAVVRVGSSTYATPDRSASLQLVVLDRGTLELRSNQAYAGTQAGAAALRDRLAQVSLDQVAVVSTPSRGALPPLSDIGALGILNRGLASIGAGPLPRAVAGSTRACGTGGGICGGFSAVGSGTFEVGQGALNPGLGTLGRGTAGGHGSGPANGGSLQGYLQRDVTGSYHTFVPGDHVSFDTTAAGTTARRAAIEVDGVVHLSEELPDPKSGAFVLVLDAGTLEVRDQGTFSLRYDSVDAIVGEEIRMSSLLRTYVDDPSALVLVQSIGRLARWDGFEGRGDVEYWWGQVARALEGLGSHRAIVNALSDHGYAQVGPGGVGGATYPASPWTAVSSEPGTGGPGQLAGTLSRNSSSQLYPSNASGRAQAGDELTVVAYQPPQPWPHRGTGAEQAALACVASSLRLSLPIEDHYDNLNLRTAWEGNAAWLEGRDRSRLACDTSGFSEAVWDDVRDQLAAEFRAVPVVHDLVDDVAEPLADSGNALAEVQAVTHAVATKVDDRSTTDNHEAVVHALDLAEDAFLILGVVPEVGHGADLVASILGLTNDAVLTDGRPETPLSEELTVQADELATHLTEGVRLQKQQLAVVREILVGDPGKLLTAATKAAGDWSITAVDQAQAVEMMHRAAKRTAYRSLFPTSYGAMIRLTRGRTTFPDAQEASQYRCWQGDDPGNREFEPFRSVPRHGAQNVYVDPGPVTEHWVYVKKQTIVDWILPRGRNLIARSFTPTMPTQGLLDDMFGTGQGEDAATMAPLEFALDVAPVMEQATIARADLVSGTSSRLLHNQCTSS